MAPILAMPGVGSLESGPAHLAELVDALVLGTSGLGRGGSSPPVGIRSFLSCTHSMGLRTRLARLF